MSTPRFRFSIRTLLIGITVLASLLALTIQFGPHVVWKTVHSNISSGVVPIPSRPLVATPPAEEFVTCNVGPVSFELPKAMANNLETHRGVGGVFLQFHDNGRSLALQLPQRADRLLQQQIEDFLEKSRLTFPRLYREIAAAQSDDFSFSMSHRELRWHKWLLATRSLISIDIDLIEFLWRPDLEGNPMSTPTTHVFQWATVDGQWEGTINFKSASPDDVDWIRQVCTTFAINGDPAVLQNGDDATIQSMITFTRTLEQDSGKD